MVLRVRVVMVTAVGNKFVDPRSKPGRCYLHFIFTFIQWERHKYFSSPLRLLGRIWSAVLDSAQIWSGVCRHWRFSSVPTRLLTHSGGWVYCLTPKSPLIKGMPTRPKVSRAMPDACGLRPCDWTHLKNGFVPDLYAVGAYDKYRERYKSKYLPFSYG